MKKLQTYTQHSKEYKYASRITISISSLALDQKHGKCKYQCQEVTVVGILLWSHLKIISKTSFLHIKVSEIKKIEIQTFGTRENYIDKIYSDMIVNCS